MRTPFPLPFGAAKTGPEDPTGTDPVSEAQHIINLILDERTVVRRSPQIEHERKIAIFDLLEDNHFAPVGDFTGPYILHLGIHENRLVFDIHDGAEAPLTRFSLGLAPFRSVVRDYFVVCESYFEAIKSAGRPRIEALDMGRRGLHDEGAAILRRRLETKAEIDNDTARRLFTLVCVLHIRGTADTNGY
jgi:uncharacterized protein (UPF0262 family)